MEEKKEEILSEQVDGVETVQQEPQQEEVKPTHIPVDDLYANVLNKKSTYKQNKKDRKILE